MKRPIICGAVALIAWGVGVFLAGYAMGWLDGAMGVTFWDGR
jgi:hypothetical protein